MIDQERSFVVGMAGHVDHGKSTLVRALTGIDPDRLAEEKERSMTIDLGFAWLTLPSGRQVSMIDVPGHERFIKNMLAGVGGIDVALLVIAADEGPMPQTEEHLAIIDLLQIPLGVVALSKTDLVDKDWLDLVAEEVRDRLSATTLANAKIVGVSAETGAGLDELRQALDKTLSLASAWPAGRRPRLPIDRVFTVSGFGTVVTGTLLGGELVTGQDLRVFPSDRATRVRGLQTHGKKVERARPGSRVAVNLASLAVEDVHRGDVLASPGALRPTHRVDVRVRLLPSSPVTLEQNDEVDFFVGAAEVPARVTLLDRERIEPGETAWVQMRFRSHVAVLNGDRFIIRRPSPSMTIGGGEIVDANPPRHKRFRTDVVGSLETLAAGHPDEILLHTLEAGPRELRALRAEHPGGLSEAQIDAAIQELIAEGEVRALTRGREDGLRPGDYVVATTAWTAISAKMTSALADFHAAQPLRRGIPAEELRSRLKLGGPQRLFDDVLARAASEDTIVDEGATIRLPSFAIVLDSERRGLADRYLRALEAAAYSPPSPAEFGIDQETLGALIDLGEIVKVAEGVVFAPSAYAKIEGEVLAAIDREGSITLAQFRDHFATSRKYAQATLEYLDQRRITRRIGDERVRFAGSGRGDGTGD
ncbi:MAG: selenocysteine-specific translation elongation factor [Thermomicrobiales bacterium]